MTKGNAANLGAMHRTHTAYRENITAVKGTNYIKFMDDAAYAMAAGECVNYALTTGDKTDEAKEVLESLLSRVLILLAGKHELPQERVLEALEDTRVMMNSISTAAELPIIQLQ
jgi:hypothetical protein